MRKIYIRYVFIAISLKVHKERNKKNSSQIALEKVKIHLFSQFSRINLKNIHRKATKKLHRLSRNVYKISH